MGTSKGQSYLRRRTDHTRPASRPGWGTGPPVRWRMAIPPEVAGPLASSLHRDPAMQIHLPRGHRPTALPRPAGSIRVHPAKPECDSAIWRTASPVELAPPTSGHASPNATGRPGAGTPPTSSPTAIHPSIYPSIHPCKPITDRATGPQANPGQPAPSRSRSCLANPSPTGQQGDWDTSRQAAPGQLARSHPLRQTRLRQGLLPSSASSLHSHPMQQTLLPQAHGPPLDSSPDPIPPRQTHPRGGSWPPLASSPTQASHVTYAHSCSPLPPAQSIRIEAGRNAYWRKGPCGTHVR
jgi:hypothetical protein